MSEQRHILVLDIGMTNKKISLYDPELGRVAEVSRSFAPIAIPAPAGSNLPAGTMLEAHDLAGIENWFFAEIRKLSAKFDIAAISVSCHGATFVCVDGELGLSAPCLLYTHEPGPDFHKAFYDLVGDAVDLQRETGTPPLSAMINPAKGIFFLSKYFPAELAQTAHILNYPAYWGARLTGKISGEATYIGNHSYLWDYQKSTWSDVADKLGIAARLPREIGSPWDRLGTVEPLLAARLGLPPGTLVTYGIHDSNASLLPYLIARGGRDFVLNSTGTWCVVMHPQDRYGYEADDLGKIVFFNQSAMRKPVKTTIFLGGLEFETWTKLVEKGLPARNGGRPAAAAAPVRTDPAHGVSGTKGDASGSAGVPEGKTASALDPALYSRILGERRVFILPEIIPGSGQFPGSAARLVVDGTSFPLAELEAWVSGRGASADRSAADFGSAGAVLSDPSELQALLYLSLVIQSLVALRRSGTKAETEVFVSGGFLKSPAYLELLSSCLPDNTVATSDIPEATSYGAALCAHMMLYDNSPEDMRVFCEVESKPVAKTALPGFEAYMNAWLGAIGAPQTPAPAEPETARKPT